MLLPIAKRIIITFITWLALFILSIKACKIVDRKYKADYRLTRTVELGFFRRFFIYDKYVDYKITWYVLIFNAMFYVFNIIFISLFVYYVYKLLWGIELWSYSSAALVFAIMQCIIPITAAAFDFFYDFKTAPTRYGIPKETISEEEEKDPIWQYESNT